MTPISKPTTITKDTRSKKQRLADANALRTTDVMAGQFRKTAMLKNYIYCQKHETWYHKNTECPFCLTELPAAIAEP